MKIAFACPHCAKSLVADAELAGRTGRCRYCRQGVVVPQSPSASGGRGQGGSGSRPAATDSRTAGASKSPAAAGRPTAAPERVNAKTAANTSDEYTLRPVTPVKMPALDVSDWDNVELGPPIDAPPSVFTSTATAVRPSSRVTPPRAVPSTAAADPTLANILAQLGDIVAPLVNTIMPGAGRPVAPGASPRLIAYRSFFGLLGRLTTWISETSYTVSLILIILAIASGMIGRHSLATMLCSAIIAFNLVGIAGDLASLVTLSFRKNPLQGGLFLVPPFTLYYLWTDWQRYSDTVLRMRIPLVTLALVAAAYVCVPWLRGGIKAEVPGVESIEQAVVGVEGQLAGQRGVLDEALKNARSWLREVPLPDPASLPGLPSTSKPARGQKP